MDENKNIIPHISCALSLLFGLEVKIELVIDELRKIGIKEVNIHIPKCEEIVSVEIASIKNEKFWYLDEALSKMFSKIDVSLEKVKKVVDKYNGTVFLDIAFYQYGTYPALEFINENMRKIRLLEAEISIDAY